MSSGFFRRSSPFWMSALLAAACANRGTGSGDTGDDGGGGGNSSGASNGSSSGSGGPSSSSGSGGSSSGIVIGDAASTSDACQQFDVQFVQKLPLVYVLVDRSGSMFQTVSTPDGGQSDEWDPLRVATLAVIQGLQSQVAFGFGAYTGINPGTTPNMCPILVQVPIALNNYSAIQTVYAPLGPLPNGQKAETPAELSLAQVGTTLGQAASQLAAQADAGAGQADGGAPQPGAQYILFVTDGETDFCDDGDAVCPADAVTAEIQQLHTQGITTLILGIASNLSNIAAPVLQGFANAGQGLSVAAPPNGATGPSLTPTDIYNQCNGVNGWHSLFSAANKLANQALATYSPAPPAANATLYSPSATDVTDLTMQIGAALAGVKSCSFDLQGHIKVDLPNAGQGSVTIDGVTVPFDATNGWTMTSATQLDLEGTACQTWRATGKDIHFHFPCEIIISTAQ